METQQNVAPSAPVRSRLNLGFLFLSLGVLITLITSVISFLNLIFDTLDKKFPDALNANYQYGYSSYDYESIRMALATLIIFFPIFLIVSYFWKKHQSGGLSSIDEIIRKWMIYIILFLSAIVVAIDLVTLVKYFVSGEITNRFIFKVLAVLLVALFVGVHYILELRNREKVFGFPVGMWSAIKASIWVILLVWFSFCVMGSPMKQRALRLDDRRVGDIQSIQWQIINYWQQKQKLPAGLTDLSNPLSGYALPVDPEFEKGYVYEYNLKAPMTFELCATFAEPMPQGWREYQNYGKGGGIMPAMPARDIAVSSYPYPGPSGMNESWDHEAGRTCFERTIDPEQFPPFNNPPKPL